MLHMSPLEAFEILVANVIIRLTHPESLGFIVAEDIFQMTKDLANFRLRPRFGKNIFQISEKVIFYTIYFWEKLIGKLSQSEAK